MGMILNWIVQGMVVAAAVSIGLWLMPAGRAGARVRVWWTTVAAVMALPLVPWLSANVPATDPSLTGASVEPLVAVPEAMWSATSIAATLWIAWIFAQGLRLFLDLHALRRARRQCRSVPASVVSRLRPSTRARLARSNVRLMESGDVRAAAVLGFGPPLIAVQPALLAQLTDSEFDQVVVHEWAHVARRDALGTLAQRVVHVLAGWHPAVSYAMRRLHMEREMACDEVVVDATGSAKAYAACLTRVAGLAQTSRGSHLAVAMLSSPGLTRRVLRLLDRRRTPAFAPQWMMVPAALAVVVAFSSGQLSVFGVRLMALPDLAAPAWAAQFAAATVSPVVIARPPAPASRPAAAPRTTSAERPPIAAAVHTPETVVAAEARSTAVPVGSALPELIPSSDTLIVSGGAAPLAGDAFVPAEAAAPLAAPPISEQAKSAWTAATQTGELIGSTSRKKAVATAGFFTRLSKKVATSF